MKFVLPSSTSLLMMAAALLCGAERVEAGTLTWSGGSGNWDTTSTDWTGSTWTDGSDALISGAAGTLTISTTASFATHGVGSPTANSLTITTAGDTIGNVTGDGTIYLGNGPSGSTYGGLSSYFSGAHTTTINSNLVLTGADFINDGYDSNHTTTDSSNTLTINGTINNSGNLLSVYSYKGFVNLNGIISGAGGLYLGGIGTGGTTISAANTFSGPFTDATNVALTIYSLANTGNAQSLGEGSTMILGSGGNAALLNFFLSSGTSDSNQTWDINGQGTTFFNSTGVGLVNFTGGAIVFTTGTYSKTLDLGGTTGTAGAASNANQVNDTLGDYGSTSSAGIYDTTSVLKNGTGTWYLGGANTYSGTTSINVLPNSTTAGTLIVDSIANGGVVTTATQATKGATTITVGNPSGLALGQTVAGYGIANGTTILSITGSTIGLSAGTTQVISGTNINVGSPNELGISSNAATNLTINGGTLQYIGGATSTDRLFSIGFGAGGTNGVGGSGGTIDSSGTGALNFTNTGTLASAVFTQNGSASWSSGATSIPVLDASEFSVGMVLSGSAFTANQYVTGVNTSTNTLTISAGASTSGGTGTVISATGGNASLTLTGSTGGSLAAIIPDMTSASGEAVKTSLVKTGSDTWTLSGASTFTGGTTVSAGTLGLTGSFAATSPLAVGAGANFALGEAAGGSSYLAQTVSTLSLTSTGGAGSGNEAKLSFNLSGANYDSMTSTGAFTLTGSTFELNLNGTATGTDNLLTWATAGSTSLTKANVDLYLNGTDLGINSSDISIVTSGSNDILEFSVAAVPEPSTWALTGIGLVLLAAVQLRRKSLA